MANLPSGYIELEYIESTGTQYIDTGYIPDSYTTVICDFMMTNPDNTNQAIFVCAGQFSLR